MITVIKRRVLIALTSDANREVQNGFILGDDELYNLLNLLFGTNPTSAQECCVFCVFCASG